MTESKIFDCLMINFILKSVQCRFINGRGLHNARFENGRQRYRHIPVFVLDNRTIVIMQKGLFVIRSGMAIMATIYIGVLVRLYNVKLTPTNFRYYMKPKTPIFGLRELVIEFKMSGLIHHLYYLLMITCFAMAFVMGTFLAISLKYKFVLFGQLMTEEFNNKLKKALFSGSLLLYIFLQLLPNYPYHIFSVQHWAFFFMILLDVVLSTRFFVSRMRYHNMIMWL